jgi:glycosyltransferase involved in cell wall biosynthesis
MPRVSVIIPTFNCGQFIGRTLNSVFAQTYGDYEVIVVDDGSTDDTRDIVTAFEGRVHYYYQPNRGQASARNVAVDKANGEFIAYLDADDLWHPHKLERQVAYLDTHADRGLVHSDWAFIDENDNLLVPAHLRNTGRSGPEGHCASQLFRWCGIQTPAVMERRHCLDELGPFDERLKAVEDYLRWILLAMADICFGYIDEPLVMVRKRASSVSTNKPRESEAYLMLFDILLYETCLASRYGQEAVNTIRARHRALQREMMYIDRLEGRTRQARRRALHLIRDSPFEAPLYLELLKSCVPFYIGRRLRSLRTH